ncbi:hypothetical protein HID58_061840 [Brassica napus]|uniref:Uncharacterized protein n=1 Tax=Brassica napus TaxID=3708 RepID=A0ABQ7ZZT4_BRANA|nr:hypothetical protein HID58_061840 [Brassica napus]
MRVPSNHTDGLLCSRNNRQKEVHRHGVNGASNRDMASWISFITDIELMKQMGTEEEMVEMLQIGLACGDLKPQDRPSSADVL